jgi:hypothetical protein
VRLIHHHVVPAGEADELPASIVLEARAELLERRRLPADGKYVPALRYLPATDFELLLECRQRLLEALGGESAIGGLDGNGFALDRQNDLSVQGDQGACDATTAQISSRRAACCSQGMLSTLICGRPG